MIIVYYLSITLSPIECEVMNTRRYPLILNLFPCTVNDMGHFVGENEFEVLIDE